MRADQVEQAEGFQELDGGIVGRGVEAFERGDDFDPAVGGERIGKAGGLVEDEIVVQLPWLDPVAHGKRAESFGQSEGLAAAQIGKQGALVLRHLLTEDRQDQQGQGVQRITAREQPPRLRRFEPQRERALGVEHGGRGRQLVGQVGGQVALAREGGGDDAQGLLGGFEKGDRAKASLDLLPLLAQRFAQAVAVVLEGLMEHDHQMQRRGARFLRLLGQQLQQMDLAVLRVIGLVFEKFAEFVDFDQESVAALLRPHALHLPDQGQYSVHRMARFGGVENLLDQQRAQAAFLGRRAERQQKLARQRVGDAVDLHRQKSARACQCVLEAFGQRRAVRAQDRERGLMVWRLFRAHERGQEESERGFPRAVGTDERLGASAGLLLQSVENLGERLKRPRGGQIGLDQFQAVAVARQVDRAGIGALDANALVQGCHAVWLP